MIIDLILDRKDGLAYDPKQFYMDCMSYNKSFPGIADEITRAMDAGTEEDIKAALSNYIRENGYKHEIIDYINEQSWLTRDFSKSFKEVLASEDSFRYRMLDRMRTDCEYYLGYGNRYAGHLWAGDERFHIDYMKALWESFPPNGKPEWLTMEKIQDYETKMLQKRSPLHDMIQSASARTQSGLEQSSGMDQKCKVTFCRTAGVADGFQFHILMDLIPKDYHKNKEDFLLDADERIAAYDEAAKQVGESRIGDFTIQSAEMVKAKSPELER